MGVNVENFNVITSSYKIFLPERQQLTYRVIFLELVFTFSLPDVYSLMKWLYGKLKNARKLKLF